MAGSSQIAFEHRHAAPLPLEIRAGHELGEMPVADEILTEKREARRRRAFAALAHPHIDADQGLDARRQRLLVELDHREQVALIGERNRGHPRGRDRRHQFRHAHDAVEQRILGVQPQMHELSRDRSCLRAAVEPGPPDRSEARRCKGHGPCAPAAAMLTVP